ncbi:hypothetical protein A5650_15405 [Mycobacterium sp. 1164985.4]|nr:hypothetical protein A5650_15405 [Mycobacterium sp. 1164985.4]
MFVGTLAVVAGALAFAAPVSAKPNTGPSWDIEAYDNCVRREVPQPRPGWWPELGVLLPGARDVLP